MKRVQQGFTLIELMIVVAIIGILAAIAIPQYQDYVTRSRWQDNIAGVGALKSGIAECVQDNNGQYANCDQLSELSNSNYIAAVSGGIYNTKFGTAVVNNATAAIAVTGTGPLNGCSVTLTPDLVTNPNQMQWVFTNGGSGCTKKKTGVGT